MMAFEGDASTSDDSMESDLRIVDELNQMFKYLRDEKSEEIPGDEKSDQSGLNSIIYLTSGDSSNDNSKDLINHSTIKDSSSAENLTCKIDATVNEQSTIVDLDDEETQDGIEIVDLSAQQIDDLILNLNHSTKDLFVQILSQITSSLSTGQTISDDSKTETIRLIDELVIELNNLEANQIVGPRRSNENEQIEISFQIGVEMIEQLIYNKNILISINQTDLLTNETLDELVNGNNNLVMFLSNLCDSGASNVTVYNSIADTSADQADHDLEPTKIQKSINDRKTKIEFELIEKDLALSDDDEDEKCRPTKKFKEDLSRRSNFVSNPIGRPLKSEILKQRKQTVKLTPVVKQSDKIKDKYLINVELENFKKFFKTETFCMTESFRCGNIKWRVEFKVINIRKPTKTYRYFGIFLVSKNHSKFQYWHCKTALRFSLLSKKSGIANSSEKYNYVFKPNDNFGSKRFVTYKWLERHYSDYVKDGKASFQIKLAIKNFRKA